MIKEGSYVRYQGLDYLANPVVLYGRVIGPELRYNLEPSRLVVWIGRTTRYQMLVTSLEEITEKEYFLHELRGK